MLGGHRSGPTSGPLRSGILNPSSLAPILDILVDPLGPLAGRSGLFYVRIAPRFEPTYKISLSPMNPKPSPMPHPTQSARKDSCRGHEPASQPCRHRYRFRSRSSSPLPRELRPAPPTVLA